MAASSLWTVTSACWGGVICHLSQLTPRSTYSTGGCFALLSTSSLISEPAIIAFLGLAGVLQKEQGQISTYCLKAKKKKITPLPFNIWFCQFKTLRSCSCKSRIHLTEHRTHFPMQSHPELLDMPAEDRQVPYTAHGNQEILVIIALNRDAPDSHHKWMCLHSPKPSRHPAETELTHSMEKTSSFNPKVSQMYVKCVTSQNHLFLSWV